MSRLARASAELGLQDGSGFSLVLSRTSGCLPGRLWRVLAYRYTDPVDSVYGRYILLTMTNANETKRLQVGMRVLAPGARQGEVVEVNARDSMARIDWTRNPGEMWVPCSIATAPGWVVL